MKVVLVECSCDMKEAEVKDDNGQLYLSDVALLGPVSKNLKESGQPRKYLQTAREDAVRLFEGAKVFLNHRFPTQEEREKKLTLPRNVQDFVGRASGAYLDGEIVKAKRVSLLNPTHAQMLKGIADADPLAFGFSIHAEGEDNYEGDVERLVKVSSIDIVSSPATTSGIYEGVQEVPEQNLTVPWDQITAEDLAKNRPDLAQALLRGHADMINTAIEALKSLSGTMGGDGEGDKPKEGDAPPKDEAPPVQEAAKDQQKMEAFVRKIAMCGVSLTEAEYDAVSALHSTGKSVDKYLAGLRDRRKANPPLPLQESETAGAFSATSLFK